MRLGQVERLLRTMVTKKVRVPLALIGESGIGKSAIVKQVARDAQVGCIDLRLATQEPGDLIGIPRSKDGTERTVWYKPNWWPNEGTRGILFLDELNRAPVEVRQAVFQLLTEWRLHEHTLPEGWVIAVAMNPEGKAGYQVEVLDPAMINRMWQIPVEHSVDEWLAWATGAELDKSIIGFISSNKEMLHKVSEDGPFPSPRSWHNVSKILQNIELDETTFTEAVAGLVGPTASASFATWIKKHYQRPVSGEEILTGYTKVQAKVKKQNRAENNATATELAALLTSRTQQNKKLSKDERKAVRQFIFDLPDHDDVRVAFIKKLPATLLSSQLIGEDDPEADKLASLYNQIFRSSGADSASK